MPVTCRSSLVIDELGSEPMSGSEVILFLRPMSYLPLRTRLHSHVRNVKGHSYWLRDLKQPVTLRQWLQTTPVTQPCVILGDALSRKSGYLCCLRRRVVLDRHDHRARNT